MKSLLVGLILFALGVACLNYTQAFGIEHHIAWASDTGAPEPSSTIFYAGVALAACGGILFGRGTVRDRSS